VGVVTIALSTYMIIYSQSLYQKLAPWLGIFERRRPHRELAVERQPHSSQPFDVLVFGLGRYGATLAARLKESGLGVLGVDFDPEVARQQRHHGMQVRFGDAEDADFFESLPLQELSWIVSALPDIESNRALLHALKENNYSGKIALVARDEAQGALLKKLGATTVLHPLRDAMDVTVVQLTTLINTEKDTV